MRIQRVDSVAEDRQATRRGRLFFLCSPFGERTWLDVRKAVARKLGRRFPRVSGEVLDDALGDVVVDLIAYWQGLASSVSEDTDRNFYFAVKRGVWRGTTVLIERFRLGSIEVLHHLPAELDGGCDDTDESPASWQSSFVDPDPTPDEVVEELDAAERARRVLEELDSVELEDWFRSLLSGESERDAAKRLGISRSAYRDRRDVRLRRARRLAVKHGLLA